MRHEVGKWKQGATPATDMAARVPETSLHTEILFESIDTGNLKQIKDLVTYDHADLGGHDWLHNGGRTPMHRAVEKGDLATMRLLVELGGDVNVPDGNGRSPVHLACRMGNDEVLRVLLSSGRAALSAGCLVRPFALCVCMRVLWPRSTGLGLHAAVIVLHALLRPLPPLSCAGQRPHRPSHHSSARLSCAGSDTAGVRRGCGLPQHGPPLFPAAGAFVSA